jgi:membrane protein YdbS with pleckstrin-like domain
MGARDRLLATAVIWGTFMVTSIVLFDRTTSHYPSRISALTLIAVMALIALAAVFGTFAVWRFWSREDDCEKQKRAQLRRIARLADRLDEDELPELDAHRITREHRPER